ncbi:hypothetical protein [Streptomyces sp. NPDC058874]|uniref:hypothetical protein n=1 Tax=unclassified Streptomyces TaxID=2593676 RepID=UPI003685BB10
MIRHIDDIGMAVLGAGLLVGYAVHKHARSGTAPKGDLVGAIGAGTAVVTVLMLLFGGDGRQPAAAEPRPSGRAVSAASTGIAAAPDPASGPVTTASGPARTSTAP